MAELTSKTALELSAYIAPNVDKKTILIDKKTFPSVLYMNVKLTEFRCSNPRGYDVSGVEMWVPSSSLRRLQDRLEFSVHADSANCKMGFLRSPIAGKLHIVLKGPNSRVLSASDSKMNFTANMIGDSLLVVGEKTFIGGAKLRLKSSDVTIGAGGLWSDEILVQATDQHGIIDLRTKEIMNAGRNSVHLGRRVWVGRRSVIGKNLIVGAGSVIGIGSIVVRSLPPACACAGVPAKVVKTGITWSNSLDEIIPREVPDIDDAQRLFIKNSRVRYRHRPINTAKNILKREWVRTSLAVAAGVVLGELITL